METWCEIIDPWKCQKWSERFVKSKNFGEVIFEMDFCPQMYSNVLFMECYNPAGIQSLFWSESLKNTLLSTNMYIYYRYLVLQSAASSQSVRCHPCSSWRPLESAWCWNPGSPWCRCARTPRRVRACYRPWRRAASAWIQGGPSSEGLTPGIEIHWD